MALLLLSGIACSKPESEAERSARKPVLRVAVAANFTTPIERIAKAFEAESGYPVEVSTGSTGKLYAQIENGAPFHVFLAADAKRPRLLEEKQLAKAGSRFTYAVGRLALYGKLLEHPEDGPRNLENSDLKHVAIANPRTAPFGAAAKQVLTKLGRWPSLEARIVRGENIAQAFQFADSGGADLGFVALSSVVDKPKDRYWLVPQALHDPIRQDAVLLKRGEAHPASSSFLKFLGSEQVRAIIETSGYGVP